MPKIRKADYCLMKGTLLHIKAGYCDDIIRVTMTQSRSVRGRVLKSNSPCDVGRLFRYVIDGLKPNSELFLIKKKDLPVELL